VGEPVEVLREEIGLNVARGLNYRLDVREVGREVDATCDRFEAAWRAGDRPRIEDFLDVTVDSDLPVLLRHLLNIELDYRAGLGESPEPSEYRRRFPRHEGLIDSIFARFVPQCQVTREGHPESLEITGWEGPHSGSAASLPPDSFPKLPGSEILSELGRGGMGVVYLARQIRLNRLCALKITLPGGHDGAEFRVRFLAEAETIARLRHRNIVQIYGMGDHDGRPYFEMEYIEGGSLAPAARRHPLAAGARGADGRSAGQRHRRGPSPGDRPSRPQAG
jgi:serine/threonine-protein kinase